VNLQGAPSKPHVGKPAQTGKTSGRKGPPQTRRTPDSSRYNPAKVCTVGNPLSNHSNGGTRSRSSSTTSFSRNSADEADLRMKYSIVGDRRCKPSQTGHAAANEAPSLVQPVDNHRDSHSCTHKPTTGGACSTGATFLDSNVSAINRVTQHVHSEKLCRVATQPLQQNGVKRPASAGPRARPRVHSSHQNPCDAPIRHKLPSDGPIPSDSLPRPIKLQDRARAFSATPAGRLTVPRRWLHGAGESSYAAAFRESVLAGRYSRGPDTYVPREGEVEAQRKAKKSSARSHSAGVVADDKLGLLQWDDSVVISKSMVYTGPKGHAQS
jgi:hypothetical protein